jgi:hypothetical protein
MARLLFTAAAKVFFYSVWREREGLAYFLPRGFLFSFGVMES